jgi:RHS repeat-associated protein
MSPKPGQRNCIARCASALCLLPWLWPRSDKLTPGEAQNWRCRETGSLNLPPGTPFQPATNLSEKKAGQMAPRQRDDSFGLLDYHARFYAPYLQRFISPDTLIPNPADGKSFDRDAYGNNNPVKENDPTGHCPWCIGRYCW